MYSLFGRIRPLALAALAGSVCLGVCTQAHGSTEKVQAKHAAKIDAVATYPAPQDSTDLKFREFFQLPVGPKGVEPTAKLLSLNGKHVRMAGYMVEAPEPIGGQFILAPVPVALGDEDESMVDDLPPAIVFVHLAPGFDRNVPFRPGVVRLSGTLQVGNQEEPDGRVSMVRLLIDAPLSKLLVGAPPRRQARSK